MTFIQLDYDTWFEQFKPITKPGTGHIAFDSVCCILSKASLNFSRCLLDKQGNCIFAPTNEQSQTTTLSS
jgi:hypothetical protein